MPASKDHIHTYERPVWRKTIYRCVDPGCSHYINKKLLLGKYAKCPECGSQFILNREKLLRARPKCDFCSNTAKSRELKQVAANTKLQEIFDSISEPIGEEDKL